MGIRLFCPNGHKVHVKSFLAGKRGICPRCGEKFDIPSNPDIASDDGGEDEIAISPAAGEIASENPIGPSSEPEPTSVSSPFAFTTPLPARPTGPSPGPKEPAGDPAALDLDALAAAGGTSLLGGHAFGPASKRLDDRRKNAQSMRRFTLALTIAVTLLACVLLYMVMRR